MTISPLRVIQLTPPGRGAIATLRVEGPTAAEIVESYFRVSGKQPLSASPIDRILFGHFGPGPGEEVIARRCSDGSIEIHCHGGHAAMTRIESMLVAAGCQSVSWQSWAANSHDDPIAAAALDCLAQARTERTAAILLDQYHSALRHALNNIQQAIDRGEKDSARQQIDILLARATLGRHLVQPWRVVLGGTVNVGKSSLINALVGYGRSIVHNAPGTTRDAVTAATAIDGWPIELCDTAGLHAGGNDVELAGIQLAKQRLAQADLVVLVFDYSVPWSNEDQALLDQWPHAFVVHNKCDLPPMSNTRPAGLIVSAIEGHGLAELLAGISSRLVLNSPPSGAAVPFNDQQVEMIRRLSAAVEI